MTAKTAIDSIDSTATAFFALYPTLPVTASWIGNSNGGTTETNPVIGRVKTHGDLAPYRTAMPTNADRIGLEYNPDRTKVALRIHDFWGEGTWANVYVTPEGRILGGLNSDVAFPRRDFQNRTPQNQWQFGSGFWQEVDDKAAWGDGGSTDYRDNLPFTELAPGPDSGVPGYSWESSDAGLVIRTPKATLYGLIGFGTVFSDPGNANLLFSAYVAHTVRWNYRGAGKEQAGFAKTFDYDRYPTDPRRTEADLTHPGVFGVARVGKGKGADLYTFIGENETLIHRWDAKAGLLVPVAAAYFRPDQLPTAIPNAPVITWGQGAIARAKDGQFSGEWEVIDAAIHGQRGSQWVYDVEPNGNLFFLPKWSKAEDANPVTKWKTFDDKAGILSTANVSYLALPTALSSADACEGIRIDWKSGDMVAVVLRASGWMLERYAGWLGAKDREALQAVYSVGPVALNKRSDFPLSATYNTRWRVSVDTTVPGATLPSTGFATMVLCGGWVVMAPVQGGNIRVYRQSDGAIAGITDTKAYLNSSMDNPTQLSATETATELRVFLMDFHGGAAELLRVSKAALTAGVKKAAGL